MRRGEGRGRERGGEERGGEEGGEESGGEGGEKRRKEWKGGQVCCRSCECCRLWETWCSYRGGGGQGRVCCG